MRVILLAGLTMLSLGGCQKMTVHTPESVVENNAESGGKVEDGIPERPMDGAIPDQNLDSGGL